MKTRVIQGSSGAFDSAVSNFNFAMEEAEQQYKIYDRERVQTLVSPQQYGGNLYHVYQEVHYTNRPTTTENEQQPGQ